MLTSGNGPRRATGHLTPREARNDEQRADIDETCGMRRDQNVTAGQPISCAHEKISDGPLFLVEKQIGHPPDDPVGCDRASATEGFGTARHKLSTSAVSPPDQAMLIRFTTDKFR